MTTATGMKNPTTTVNNTNKDCGRHGGYECKTCKRRFDTYQALGGHQGTHKRVKLNDSNDARLSNLDMVVPKSSGLHRCKTCMKEFETGQALGGHMRRHRVEKALLFVETERFWQQMIMEKAESDLMLVPVEPQPLNAESDLMLVPVEPQPLKVWRDLMVVTVEPQPLKSADDKRHEKKSELVLAAKEWRLAL